MQTWQEEPRYEFDYGNLGSLDPGSFFTLYILKFMQLANYFI
jgi:hypothetical protein